MTRAWHNKHPENVISNPRGLGLFAAFDASAPQTRNDLRKKCMEKCLIVLPSGERSIRFRGPALNVSQTEIDEGMSIIRSCV